MVQVLGNNESRGSYDYALAHPREHMIAYYARYGSRAYAQMKIPAHYSITGLVLIISFIQYLSRKMSHEKVCIAPAHVLLWSASATSKDRMPRWIALPESVFHVLGTQLCEATNPVSNATASDEECSVCIRVQLMRRIRQSSKYKQRLKELLNERTLANTNGSPSKPRKSVQKPRQKGCAPFLAAQSHRGA